MVSPPSQRNQLYHVSFAEGCSTIRTEQHAEQDIFVTTTVKAQACVSQPPPARLFDAKRVMPCQVIHIMTMQAMSGSCCVFLRTCVMIT
jgi:hypothetical protein